MRHASSHLLPPALHPVGDAVGGGAVDPPECGDDKHWIFDDHFDGGPTGDERHVGRADDG